MSGIRIWTQNNNFLNDSHKFFYYNLLLKFHYINLHLKFPHNIYEKL